MYSGTAEDLAQRAEEGARRCMAAGSPGPISDDFKNVTFLPQISLMSAFHPADTTPTMWLDATTGAHIVTITGTSQTQAAERMGVPQTFLSLALSGKGTPNMGFTHSNVHKATNLRVLRLNEVLLVTPLSDVQNGYLPWGIVDDAESRRQCAQRHHDAQQARGPTYSIGYKLNGAGEMHTIHGATPTSFTRTLFDVPSATALSAAQHGITKSVRSILEGCYVSNSSKVYSNKIILPDTDREFITIYALLPDGTVQGGEAMWDGTRAWGLSDDLQRVRKTNRLSVGEKVYCCRTSLDFQTVEHKEFDNVAQAAQYWSVHYPALTLLLNGLPIRKTGFQGVIGGTNGKYRFFKCSAFEVVDRDHASYKFHALSFPSGASLPPL